MATTDATQTTQSDFSIGGIVDHPVDELKPWPGNPRKHAQRQIVVLANNIRQFGFTNPIITDEYRTILSGHGRLLAAQQMGLVVVPTRVISGLSEAQKAAFVVADNKLGELSEWDDALLKQQIDIVIQADIQIELTGLSTAEVDLMFGSPDEKKSVNPDDLQAEDIPETIVSRVGDLWVCGNHLLYCGNALEEQSYTIVMRGESAQMIFADLPYNLRSASIGSKGKIKHADFVMAAGEMSPQAFTAFLATAFGHTHAFSVDGAIHYYGGTCERYSTPGSHCMGRSVSFASG